MIVSESEKGLGLPGELNVPNGLQQPIDMSVFDGREVIQHADSVIDK